MPHLTIITALKSEAVPLIDHYRLAKQTGQQGFHLYQSDTLDLIVCGIGARRVKKALNAYHQSAGDDLPKRWLNIGSAGTLDLPIGSLVWVNTVAGQVIGFPDDMPSGPSIDVVSLSAPSDQYLAKVLFDMEAQQCLESITQFSREYVSEDFFCAKVISDNQYENSVFPSINFDKSWLISLIRQKIDLLDKEIYKLIKT